jgi:hypothetical protein
MCSLSAIRVQLPRAEYHNRLRIVKEKLPVGSEYCIAVNKIVVNSADASEHGSEWNHFLKLSRVFKLQTSQARPFYVVW